MKTIYQELSQVIINEIKTRFKDGKFPDPKLIMALVKCKHQGLITHRELRDFLDIIKI